jgi:hypothetical protein
MNCKKVYKSKLQIGISHKEYGDNLYVFLSAFKNYDRIGYIDKWSVNYMRIYAKNSDRMVGVLYT